MTFTDAPKSPITPGGRQPDVRSVFSFRNRGLLGGLLLVPAAVAVVFSHPTLAGNGFPALLLNAGGWIFFLLCAGVRVWATLYVGGHKDRQLETEGPYSLCRNPLYFGSLCFAISIACFLKSITFSGALLVAAFVYFHWVVRAEERYLELRFGEDFRSYCRRTPRFWPRRSAFQTGEQVEVDVKRLKNEIVRLGRAALIPIILQTIAQLNTASWWPHWFTLF